MMTKTIVCAAACALALVGCAASADPVDEREQPTASTESAASKCVDIALCVQGYVWSQRSCSCVPDHHGGGGGGGGGGASCGAAKHCGAGQYCCNASCGICAPIGSACIQIACTTPL